LTLCYSICQFSLSSFLPLSPSLSLSQILNSLVYFFSLRDETTYDEAASEESNDSDYDDEGGSSSDEVRVRVRVRISDMY
jgi:hypothetical protein